MGVDPLQKVGGTCPPVHPMIDAHRFVTKNSLQFLASNSPSSHAISWHKNIRDKLCHIIMVYMHAPKNDTTAKHYK